MSRPVWIDIPPPSAEDERAWTIAEAQAIQRALLPAGPLRAGRVEITYKFRPFAEVGGDFLDYFSLPDRRLGIYLGDVVGKSLPAALYASLVMGILRGLNKTGKPPTAIVHSLNQRLLERIVPERFCMLQYALYDPDARVLTFTNAGLSPPIHVSASGCRELGSGGMPCGLVGKARYELQTVTLSPGDAVIFLTDGLIEAQNGDGELFGAERLTATCAAHREPSAESLLDRAFEAVDAFTAGARQHDDMAACALQVT